jgi:uncharacterized protein (TIGR03083 family)
MVFMRWQVLDADPVDVFDVLRTERDELIQLLSSLGPAAWTTDTDCPGWQVRDIAAHLLHDDLRLLAHLRDGHQGGWFKGPVAELGPWLHARNHAFVSGSSDLSSALLVELLSWTGAKLDAVYASRDPRALDDSVAWAVPDGPAPNWLGTGREYTERFAHQNQIRRAVGVGELGGERWLGPALDIWRWCLPVALRDRVGSLTISTTEPERLWRIVDGRFVESFVVPDASVTLPARALAAVWTEAPSASLGEDNHGDPALLDALARARAIIV